MSESAPVEPLRTAEKSPEAGWIRFVLPQPATMSVRTVTSLLRHAAGECIAWAVVVAVALALLAPILVFAVAGGWALYTYAHTLVALWQHVKTYQLSNLAPMLDSLDLASRVALASAGYFALLSALIVLMAGLLGRRWRRLFLFPGITFTLPSALAFFFGLRLSLDDLAKPLRISSLAQTALLIYLLLDVILLAAALVDVSPRKRHTRRTRRFRGIPEGRQRTLSAPLAPIYFGPSHPLTTIQADVAEALAILPEVTTEAEPDAPAQSTSRCNAGDTKSVTVPKIPTATEEGAGENVGTGATAKESPAAPPLASVG